MSPHQFRVDPRFHLRRGLTACLLALLAAGIALVVAHEATLPSSRRVAIRVDCRDGSGCALAEELALDVWSEERARGEPLDVVIAELALDRLGAAGAFWTVIDPDIDATARAETERLRTHSKSDADWFAEFRDYTAIEARLSELAELAPQRASVQSIGSTLDGRPIWALHVGGASDNDAMPMLINGTQHAREWISAMAATCIADRLVREYDSDPAIRAFVDTTDAWIVPVVNPDGYQYSWGQDRYWRKTRRGGHGVDLNRNFSVAWGGGGSSGSKRSETYRGDAPFSEPETIALRSLVKGEGIRLHVDLHAYGQLVLFPWNHGAKRTDDHARFASIGDDVASAIFATHQNKYRLMRGVELYPAAGTMSDWMYGEAGATSFTIELRPRSGSGFVLPPTEIKPTCDEAMAAVLALRASRHLR
ncbi:MAG: M14 family metallocarboxypeptidase [Deltaproteobacteria bacterium]|nr:M14 family metallocarboxypeptidase [Deltaproteobacteria bacterium]